MIAFSMRFQRSQVTVETRMNQLLISINGASQALGLGRTKSYELINGGRIETVTIGSRRLVKVASVHALIEQVDLSTAR